MMATHLLPPGSSPLEVAIATLDAERMEAIEIDINTLWNPWACPAAFLPFLAWTFSVDVWNPDWPEARKRAVIAAAYGVHARKGTRRAVREALASLGWDVAITEWWEAEPQGAPYTFAVDLASEETITPERQAEALAAIETAKNVRSHLTGLVTALRQTSRTPLRAAASLLGEVVAVYPWVPGTLETRIPTPLRAAALYGAEIGTVYPLEAA
jgi:phage tail P2-like protein